MIDLQPLPEALGGEFAGGVAGKAQSAGDRRSEERIAKRAEHERERAFGDVMLLVSDAQLRDDFAKAAAAHRADVARTIRSCGAPILTLRTDRDWIADIVRFVESRRRGALAGRQ